MPTIFYRTRQVGAVTMFYREAGAADAPVLLLLHGFPTSSHMFRDLIPLLAERYRVIAPDLPGFGLTQAPARGGEGGGLGPVERIESPPQELARDARRADREAAAGRLHPEQGKRREG